MIIIRKGGSMDLLFRLILEFWAGCHGGYIAGGSASDRLVGIPLALRRNQYPWPFSTVLNVVYPKSSNSLAILDFGEYASHLLFSSSHFQIE